MFKNNLFQLRPSIIYGKLYTIYDPHATLSNHTYLHKSIMVMHAVNIELCCVAYMLE